MNKKLQLRILAILIVSGISVSLLLKNLSVDNQNQGETLPDEEQYVCQMDAKLCPDGSYVGRTGKDCHFRECPSPSAGFAKVQTTLGQIMTGLNVSITPKELVSDSRCPLDVQCIWEGTVEVRTVLSTQVSHGEHVMKLGVPQTFGDYTVTLTQVTPGHKAGVTIPGSSYRFTYEVMKN